jgi:hypothetical protein
MYPNLTPKETKPKMPEWLPQPPPIKENDVRTTRDDKSPPPGKDGI